MSREKSLTKEMNLTAELGKSGVTVLRFSAPWCGPCRTVAPILEKISEELVDTTFLKIDTDEYQDIAIKFGIRSIPTIILLDKDENILETEHIVTEQALVQLIEKHSK